MADRLGLKSLKSFRAIMRLGSITAATPELGLSQPAVSRLIAKLEKEIGFELFHRERGRLTPTSEALLFLEQVDHALGGIERVADVARDIAGNRMGRLKLVAPPSFSEGLLPEVVAVFLDRFPGVHLTLESRSVETAKMMIATREVDAGFVKRPVGRPDLREELVAVSECACLLYAGHKLAALPQLDPRALADEPLILLGQGRSSRTQIESAFAASGVRPIVRVDAHTIGAAAALAARGIGVAIVNSQLARPYLRADLVERPFRPKLMQEYSFCTSASTPPTRLAAAFLALTREQLPQLMGQS